MSILKNLIDGLTIIHDKLDKAGKVDAIRFEPVDMGSLIIWVPNLVENSMEKDETDAKLIALGFRVDRGWVGNLINNYTVEYCF